MNRTTTISPVESCLIYTPADLAKAIVKAVGQSPQKQWLEPSSGNGVFLRAIKEFGVTRSKITAVDLANDPEPNDDLAQTLRGVDFLSWAKTTRKRFDYIVGNPPYVAVRDLPGQLRESASDVVGPDGTLIGLRANCWYAFLCTSIRLLREGGSLGFVLPASWEYADYAAPLRKALPEKFEQVNVYRCHRPLFQTVGEGCVVLIAHGADGGPGNIRRKTYLQPSRLLAAMTKNSQHSYSVQTYDNERSNLLGDHRARLGDVMKIFIGGVTGDASFFLLNESRRQERELPVAACRPVLSRAHHLLSSEIDKAIWEKLRSRGERVWLFDPPASMLTHPAVTKYLKLPEKDGGCKRTRFKISTRSPWHHTPLPPAPDGFISGMSQSGPWIAFRLMPRLSATNTLYGVKFTHNHSSQEKVAWALSLLTSEAREQIWRITRKYAKGLTKIEPGDLAKLRVSKPPHIKGSITAYRRAVMHLLEGDLEQASSIADTWFLSGR